MERNLFLIYILCRSASIEGENPSVILFKLLLENTLYTLIKANYFSLSYITKTFCMDILESLPFKMSPFSET